MNRNRKEIIISSRFVRIVAWKSKNAYRAAVFK